MRCEVMPGTPGPRQRREAGSMCDSAVDALSHVFHQRVQRHRLPQNALHVQPFEVLTGAGHDDDRDVSRRCSRGDILLDDEAIDLRQTEVEHDGVRRVAVDSLQRVESVGGLVHLESRNPKRSAEHIPKGVIVFHDQDGCARLHCGMIRDRTPSPKLSFGRTWRST